MPTQQPNSESTALLQGTLDLLILTTLVLGPCHEQGFARSIQRQPEEVDLIDHGSLSPALQRLEDRKWNGVWRDVSENDRRARFCSLLSRGHEPLGKQTSECRHPIRAMGRIRWNDGGEEG